MRAIGVYVHFPWCLKKCPYCDFVSFAETRDRIDHVGYANAVIAEIERRRDSVRDCVVTSVFFGGGTPSLWEPRELGRVLQSVNASIRFASDVEVTVECNPTSLDKESADALYDVGATRLSVGVQGLDADRLQFLGRLHDPEQGLDAVRAAVASKVPRVSADFIYAVPVPTADGLARSHDADAAVDEVLRIASTGVTHLSAYNLTIEPGTQFGELARQKRLPLASEANMAASFTAIENALEAQGYEHYEISNYAKPGEESRHNLGYWRGQDYLGLGCAAFGTLSQDQGAVRYRNIVNPTRYMENAKAGDDTTASKEKLDAEICLKERIMLGLRVREGLDIAKAREELGIEFWTDERKRVAKRLVQSKRLEIDAERTRIRIPKTAWMFADGIARDLF